MDRIPAVPSTFVIVLLGLLAILFLIAAVITWRNDTIQIHIWHMRFRLYRQDVPALSLISAVLSTIGILLAYMTRA